MTLCKIHRWYGFSYDGSEWQRPILITRIVAIEVHGLYLVKWSNLAQ